MGGRWLNKNFAILLRQCQFFPCCAKNWHNDPPAPGANRVIDSFQYFRDTWHHACFKELIPGT